MYEREKLKDLFLRVETLSFLSMSDQQTGWNGSGNGEVEVLLEGNQIIFEETGTWENNQGKKFGFKNTYRWTLQEASLKLEHLRFGSNAPVYLFDLQQVSSKNWSSVCSHKCDLDDYTASMSVEENKILLNWKVNGPQKNETINYCYTLKPK